MFGDVIGDPAGLWTFVRTMLFVLLSFVVVGLGVIILWAWKKWRRSVVRRARDNGAV